jgi:DUF4097 and DUF4098 domain-containing protein YvlB
MLCFLLFVAGSVMATTLEETFTKRLPFTSGGFLSLSNRNGEIEIKSWDEDEVEIVAYKWVRASGRDRAQQLMDRVEVRITEKDNTIEIETIMPGKSSHGGGFFDWIFSGNRNYSCAVSYELRVPEEIDLDIGTTNGEIKVNDIIGRLRLKSTNGKINGRGIDGLVKCKTTNGSIKMSLDGITDGQDLSFKTTNGSIRLYLPSDFGGYVDLKTTNGHIDSDFSLSNSRRQSKKHYSGRINGGDCELECTTTNGSIYLYQSD